MLSLNLLPDEIKSQIKLSKKNARLRQLLFKVIFTSIAIVALFAVVNFYLYTEKIEAINQKRIATEQIDATNDSFNKATDLYTRINLIKKINSTAINWTKVLSGISEATPATVAVDNLSFSLVARSRITGNAASDKDIAAFKETLAANKMFTFVDIESINVGTDIKSREVRVFVISFTLSQDNAK